MPVYLSGEDNNSSIKKIGKYFPWHPHKAMGGSSVNYDKYSKSILDFKEGKSGELNKFLDLINPLLGSNFLICVALSHVAYAAPGPLHKLSNLLPSLGSERIDASNTLIRFKTIDKLSRGGSRSLDTHMQSIKIYNPEIIRGKDILLIDDVTTSGNSLGACKTLLLAAGVKSVQCLALG
ncbi:MAG: phosphoribosyltransferase [Alphaproteobacteria bacterium]|nr:phosphoribosyltransferase [Alphaproteobacteria bacterium]